MGGSTGYGASQGEQRYGGSQGYQGSQGYGQPSSFYGQGSQRYGQGTSGYDEGMGRDQGTWRGGQGSWGAQQQYGQTGRTGSQADGWSGEPDEMRWGRQQGLYGSSEYGGYISSQRSQADYQSHIGKGPKGWQRSDERIREEVNETLARHPEIDASEIEVRVEKGEVTLTGTVDDRRTKRLAEDIVERVFGVKDVENKVKVKGRGFFGLGGDRDVTTKADRETGAESQETRRTKAGATTETTSGSTTR
jgi:osmotically-inducible protein OsmY